MTIMLILGIIAALYCVLLFVRCAIYALPIITGAGTSLHLYQLGFGWIGPIMAGLVAGGIVCNLGRHVMRSGTPALLRGTVLLLFAGSAVAAGYQVAAAFTSAAGFDPFWQHGFALLTGLIAGRCSWRDLVGPGAPPPIARSGQVDSR